MSEPRDAAAGMGSAIPLDILSLKRAARGAQHRSSSSGAVTTPSPFHPMSHRNSALPTRPPVPVTTRLHARAADVARHLALVVSEEMLWRMIVFFILLNVHFPA